MNTQTQEALKELVDLFYVGTIRFTDDRVMKALTKAKEALAQPAQEPVAFCKHGVPKGVCTLGEKDCNPAPSWQGLSDTEYMVLASNFTDDENMVVNEIGFARAIEQALKEKNHG